MDGPLKQERLLLETNALKIFITAQSRVRLEHGDDRWEFELLEDAIDFVGIHPELFDSSAYDEFFAVLMNRTEPKDES